MKDPQESCEGSKPVPGEEPAQNNNAKDQAAAAPADSSRRSFIGKLGMGSAAAVALAAVPLKADASVVPYSSRSRAAASYGYRSQTAENEYIDIGELPDNGDAARFTDFSGSWSKCLPHPYLGIVNPQAWLSLTYALQTGRFQDFQNIIVGNPGGPGFTGTLNGPLGSLAFDLEGRDSHATNIPPAPSITSAQTAAEMVEHYWASQIRDVQFTDYASNSLVAQACADMNRLSYVRSPGSQFPYPVTPANLFRGQFYPGDGNVVGPYISQFLLQPTFLGVQPLSQMFQRFLSVGEGGADYCTNPHEYNSIESGFPPSFSLRFDPTYRFVRMGRDMTAYTHVDALHQEYFIAGLVLAGLGCPVNPGNPYIGSLSEHGFGTFGSASSQAGPVDAVGTIPEMATRALKAAWFHKWIVNLRQRPEEMGALLQARATNQHPMPQASQYLHPDLLNSAALPLIFSKYGGYLLPLAFPEGAPTHPCYPTGHGTVGGACIAAIKFFFDGNQNMRQLLVDNHSDVMVPSQDGLSLVPYTGHDRDQLTVNSELQKLAFNVTFGHGIHAGIHFRSSSYWSIILGEAVGISVLYDRANSYFEPFNIQITKFDGTVVNLTNENPRH
ncbi:MAG TPA: twin-arginine translocation signal domain-containing protein [Candidatus Bathyarchaeia archaeon]|nr:twin-arginine translocation signal domain-containing protein [Candidatus Bathyarchaeia archaeon]